MHTEIREITRTLPVPLTDRETEDYTQRMIASLDKKESLDADLKFYRETIKGQQADQDNTIAECKGVLKDGTLPKPVRCEKLFDYEAGTVTVVRTDSGEVVEAEAMTAEQRQQGLAFTPKKPLTERNQTQLEAEWEAHIKAEAKAEGEDPEQAWQDELASQGRIIPLRGRKESEAA